METVLLTTFENVEDSVKYQDTNSRTHIGVKFGEFYLAAGSSFADLLSTSDLDFDVKEISQKLFQSKFWALIPTSKGLSYDFVLRRIHLADVHFCTALQRTMTGELNDVSSENSMTHHLDKWNPESFSVFILFSESQSNQERKEFALRTLLDSLAQPVSRSMIGNPVAVISTPFKNLTLFNTYSQGVISNVLGEDNCIFLIDVKLSVGCEGSPVFSLHNRILGMVMSVFTWVKGEWIGFSLAANLYAVVCSWINSSYPKLYSCLRHELDCIEGHTIDSYGIVVVTASHKWGTGVILNKNQGIIITCSHVVDFTTKNDVTITFKGRNVRGQVMYATPRETPFDLAIIKVDSTTYLTDAIEFKNSSKEPERGEMVYVIGYPLFSSKIRSVKGPSLTHGYVAKVYPAAMLMTTCVTNSGASGGALIRPNGELLGLVANNVIVRNDNLLIPHITVVIPSSVFWSPVERFSSDQRLAHLDALKTSDQQVINVWQLTFAGRFLKSNL